MRDHQQQKDHKQPMRLNHQGSSREKDDPIESFMEEKITIQNNQHFGQDQLWLKKVIFGLHVVGKGSWKVSNYTGVLGKCIRISEIPDF